MRDDWETPPTVEGIVVRAWIGQDGMPDVMHVQGIDVADDVGNLLRMMGNEDNPNQKIPFSLVGKEGTFARHGYTDEKKLIGKKCLLYSGGRFDMVSIEPEQGENWPLVIWCEYN